MRPPRSRVAVQWNPIQMQHTHTHNFFCLSIRSAAVSIEKEKWIFTRISHLRTIWIEPRTKTTPNEKLYPSNVHSHSLLEPFCFYWVASPPAVIEWVIYETQRDCLHHWVCRMHMHLPIVYISNFTLFPCEPFADQMQHTHTKNNAGEIFRLFVTQIANNLHDERHTHTHIHIPNAWEVVIKCVSNGS